MEVIPREMCKGVELGNPEHAQVGSVGEVVDKHD